MSIDAGAPTLTKEIWLVRWSTVSHSPLEQERRRAKRLVARLRELGVEPDTL